VVGRALAFALSVLIGVACSDDEGTGPEGEAGAGGDSSSGGATNGGSSTGGAAPEAGTGGEAGESGGPSSGASAGVGGGRGGSGGSGGTGGLPPAPGTDWIPVVDPHCDPAHVVRGSVWARTDEELEALRWYNVVEGDLWITDLEVDESLEAYVTSLSSLGCLTRVDGALSLEASRLASLAGLENLVTVGGDLRFVPYLGDDAAYFNFARTNLEGVEKLTSVGGNLEVSGQVLLTTLDGLDSLERIDGGLRLSGNPALANIDALLGVTALGGDLTVGPDFGDLHTLNDALTNLDGLANLTSLGGNVEIVGNPELASIAALRGLTAIPGNVRFVTNPRLLSLDGLHNVTTIGGDLRFDTETIDHDFSGPGLDDLSGLEALESVGGTLVITEFGLDSVDGLDRLATIGGLYVFLDAIRSLRGLAAVREVSGDFYISGNRNLPQCEAEWLLGSVGPANIGGSVLIGTNGAGTCPVAMR
jgi:hypothetical protein